jgi:mRNA-degrading endonuclease RelE of RelBE toxin-antitoxin system
MAMSPGENRAAAGPETEAWPLGSFILRLRGWLRAQYRLRIGEIRVFYDISGSTVEILAITQIGS